MPQQSDCRSGCPLNIALEIFGDRWTLLVIRDLMLKGAHSFGDLMEGGESIATNILADRLDLLVEQQIVYKARMASDLRKFLYRLTEKGMDLAPVLVEMMVWAASHNKTDAPTSAIKQMKTNRSAFLRGVRKKWEEDGSRLNPEGADE